MAAKIARAPSENQAHNPLHNPSQNPIPILSLATLLNENPHRRPYRSPRVHLVSTGGGGRGGSETIATKATQRWGLEYILGKNLSINWDRVLREFC